ncbi:hypothetical protein F4802DRAFT_483486 [Xylaria palmicola]|nr:hypothetical protein F4802DRAFT_483486 [Xylaria palmicola]
MDGDSHRHHRGLLPPPRLRIEPPLLNSANPWATTLAQLRALYRCAATGAVTTRTALLGGEGFPHDDAVHRFAFFEAGTHRVVAGASNGGGDGEGGGAGNGEGLGEGDASLNTLGYSPIPLDGYLGFIRAIDEEEEEAAAAAAAGEVEGRGEGKGKGKPVIVSITGTPDEVAACYRAVARCAGRLRRVLLALEVNLSCPNIPGKPPPAYEGAALREYVRCVSAAAAAAAAASEEQGEKGEGEGGEGEKRIPWGLKTPPYTHAGQFEMFISALRDYDDGDGQPAVCCPVSFVTATNTLGSCLLLTTTGGGGGESRGEEEEEEEAVAPALPGLGIGGMAGAPLHPLALGNVATLRRMLDAAPETRHVDVLGVGGVSDAAGFRRMRAAGAAAVGVGTALGIRGMGVFGEIETGLGGVWEV